MKHIKKLFGWMACGSAAMIVAEQVAIVWASWGLFTATLVFVGVFGWLIDDLSKGETLGVWCGRRKAA